jgi:hypothetical protein
MDKYSMTHGGNAIATRHNPPHTHKWEKGHLGVRPFGRRVRP